VFIRHPEPQLKRCYSEPQLKEYHVLNPYPEPQLKGYVSSHNSRNSSNLTSKHYQKLCRTPYEVQQLGLTAAKSPSGGHVPLGATASRPPGGGHVPPGAKRLKLYSLINYRLAGQTPPPGATASYTLAWRNTPHRQAPSDIQTYCTVATAWRVESRRQAPSQNVVTCWFVCTPLLDYSPYLLCTIRITRF